MRSVVSYEIRHGDAVGQWVGDQLGFIYHPEDSQAIGLLRAGEIVAGIVYEGWNGRSITAHLVIRRYVTRAFLRVISEYPFKQLGAWKVIAPVFSDNAAGIRAMPKIGFIEEARILNAQPGGDIVLFTLTQSNCRYLGERYG